MTIINGAINLTKKEIDDGRAVCRFVTHSTKRFIEYKLINERACLDIGLDSDVYQPKIDKLSAKFSQLGLPEEVVKTAGATKGFAGLLSLIEGLLPEILFKQIKPEPFNPQAHSTSLKLEQSVYNFCNKLHNAYREAYIALSEKSTNPDVIKIENVLKEKYGVQTALLNNDLEAAEKVLVAVKLAHSKNIKIPNEFIVSDYTLYRGTCMRGIQNGEERNSVILASTKIRNCVLKTFDYVLNSLPVRDREIYDKWKNFCGFETSSSTEALFQVETHEIMHQIHSPLQAFRIKKIPEKFLPVVRKLSRYSAMCENDCREIYAELASKKVLMGLEKDEAKLFDYLNGVNPEEEELVKILSGN